MNDPFASIQAATRSHRRSHGCGAYTFEDGPGLARVAASAGATRILELGTALGYTACCLASSTPEATVDTIECDPEHASLARQQIAAAGFAARISVHLGDFEEVLARLPGLYDLIFFDGFEPDIRLLGLLRTRLAPAGTLVCANIGLADVRLQSWISANLGATNSWERIGSIEKGGTIVFRRL